MGYKPSPHEIKNQTIKDLIFVISEVANYLRVGEELNQSKISHFFIPFFRLFGNDSDRNKYEEPAQ